MGKRITLSYWKDRSPNRFSIGRNASLRDLRSWSLVVGRHIFSFELHGWGPNP